MERQTLPANIQKQMKAYRQGFTNVPQDYIDWHAARAELALQELQHEHNIIVHNVHQVNDGWLDGMRVVQAVVETPSGKLHKFVYNDSNQGFMRKYESGGAGSLHDEDLK